MAFCSGLLAFVDLRMKSLLDLADRCGDRENGHAYQHKKSGDNHEGEVPERTSSRRIGSVIIDHGHLQH